MAEDAEADAADREIVNVQAFQPAAAEMAMPWPWSSSTYFIVVLPAWSSRTPFSTTTFMQRWKRIGMTASNQEVRPLRISPPR